jgi:subtilisin family serine protease
MTIDSRAAVRILALAMVCVPALASAQRPSKIDQELDEKLGGTAEPIPIFVLLAEESGLDQTSYRRFPQLTKKAWRTKVITDLKQQATSTQRALLDMLATAGHHPLVERQFWIVNGLSLRMTPDAIRWLAKSDRVAQIYFRWEKPKDLIHKEGRFTRAFEQPKSRPITVDEVTHPQQPLSWNLTRIQADLVWSRLGLIGRGVVIAILDSGVNYRHSDLVHHLWRNKGEVAGNGKDDDGNGYVDDIYGYNFANDNSNIDDDFFHGTSSASIMVGDGRGGILTGVAPGAELMILRMYDQMTRYNNSELWRAYQYDAWEAYEYAASHGADVINMSFAWEPAERPLHAVWRVASTNVVAAGIAMVAGSGNFRGYYHVPDQIRPPASVAAVITTGGTLEDDQISPLSSRGPVDWHAYLPFTDHPLPTGLSKPDVSAPFGNFPMVAFRGRGYQVLSGQAGSSLTSPHVAGVIALMLEQNPELMPDQILDRLVRSCRDIGELGTDPYAGAGLVQAYDAIVLDDLPRVQVTGLRFDPPADQPRALVPGTTATVTLKLSNTGATGTSAAFTLESSVASVTINRPTAVIDRLGESGGVNFPVTIAPDAKTGSLAKLALRGEFARAGRMRFEFDLPVYGSDVLLVDDDGGGETERPWKESLARLGQPFDFFSMWRQDPARLTALSRYRTVIWLKGEEVAGILDATRRRMLSDYVLRGGRLVLSGQNVATELKGEPFLAEVFGVRFVQDLGRVAILKGTPGLLDRFEAPYTGNSLPDAIAPTGPGTLVISIEKPEGSGLAVATDRSLFLSLELGDVGEAAARDRLVALAIRRQ